VKRRFEYIINNDKVKFIDDYAHHPSELKYTIATIKKLFPDKSITGIFQPHLFSRTRDFLDDFAQVLNELDNILLLDIYPARELPIDGINAELLLSKMTNPNKKVVQKEDLPEEIRKDANEIFVTLGAGDIDRLVAPIKEVLQER
jgi:UDP-N-acetylmuramate--alanine ligase